MDGVVAATTNGDSLVEPKIFDGSSLGEGGTEPADPSISWVPLLLSLDLACMLHLSACPRE